MCCRFPFVGCGRSITIDLSVSSTILLSWQLAPSTLTPIGVPWPSVNKLRFVPDFALSVGFLPVFSPQTPAAQLSTSSQTTPPPPIPETCRAPCFQLQVSWVSPSTDNPSVAHTKSLSKHDDRPSVAAHQHSSSSVAG